MIRPEHWILLALKDASQGYGFDINKWFLSEKPDEFVINNTDFRNLIDNLERNGIIKTALRESANFYLSDKGKKELDGLKKELKFKDFYHVISNFPNIELKERVKLLESFVLSSIILTVGSVVILRLSQIYSFPSSNIIYFILFLYFFIIIASYYVGYNLAGIILFWINDVQRETLWKYKEWFWNNQDIIKTVSSGLFIIVIIVVFNYLDIYKWQDSFGAIVFGIIAICIYELFVKKRVKLY